jgi:hypothetical protein
MLVEAPATEAEPKLAVAFAGNPVVERATGPVQFVRVMEIVELTEPCAIVWAAGLTASVKFVLFWFRTERLSATEWLIDPPVPVTVGLQDPSDCGAVAIARLAVRAPVPAGNVTEEAEVVVPPTVQVAEAPFGREPAVRVTDAVKPLEGASETT